MTFVRGRSPARLPELLPLLKLAAPVSLALLGGLFMQMVDTIFVGRLGPEAIGGVSIGNAVFATLMVVGIGLLTGLDYLVSHAFGAGKLARCHECLVQGLYVAGAMSIVSTILMWLVAGQLWRLGLNAEVAHLGTQYLRMLSLSLLPFLLFTAIRLYLQAMGVAMPALVILVAANLVNALGNWVFVYGRWGMPSLGVRGSGLSTLVSRLFMLAAIVGYTLLRDQRLHLGLRETPRRLTRALTVELVKLGLPSGLQMLFEVGVFALATLLAGKLGAVPLAAHQIVLHLASFTFMIPLGMSSATAVRVGQALGAGERDRAVHIGWTAILTGMTFAVVMGLAMWFMARPLIQIFTMDAQVLRVGTSLLLVAALFQVSDATQVIGTGVLRGIGNTKVSMYTNLAGHWLVGLPVGYALCFSIGQGVHGLWVGLSIGLTVVGLVLLYTWSRQSRTIVVGKAA